MEEGRNLSTPPMPQGADGGPVMDQGGKDVCVQHLLIAQAKATPHLQAVCFEDGAGLSYQELDTRSDTLMWALRRLGVRPDGLVGVRLPRSIAAVVSFVGILKSGGAYVAIDTCFPQDRQAHILNESGLKVLILPKGGAGQGRKDAGEGIAIIEVGPSGELLEVCSAMSGEGGSNEEMTEEDHWIAGAPQDPRSLAYVLYTSGSTGKPKGVMVEHRGVVSLLEYFREQLQMKPGDAVLGLTTFCFDISVLELFLPLCTGARLCMVSAATQKDPMAIMDILEKEKITLLQATPATFEMLMVMGWKGHPRVHCICGGEAFRLNLLPLVQVCASFRNGYGPTEATVYITTFLLPKGRPLDAVPIGTALPGLLLYVLDENKQPKALGEPGELYVAGTGVARGYLKRPDLTAERFTSDPFYRGNEGQRESLMYRTGDEVKWMVEEEEELGDAAEGGSAAASPKERKEKKMVLAYLGRMDSQVKINGFRIELGEIEKVLQTHQGVGGAVVCCREDVLGRPKALVAYIMPAAASSASGGRKGGSSVPIPPSIDALRDHLGHSLPPYMVPDLYVFLSSFPLSPNGKVDRKALPPPLIASSTTSIIKERVLSPPPEINGVSSSTIITTTNNNNNTVWSDSSSLSAEDASTEEDEEESSLSDHPDIESGNTTYRKGSKSPMVQLVARLICEQSGAEVGASSSMSAIGLDSLGMVVILSKLSHALGGMRVPPTAVFDHETVRSFVGYLSRRVQEERPDLMESLGLLLNNDDVGGAKALSKRATYHSHMGLRKAISAAAGSTSTSGTPSSSSSVVGNVASLTASLTGLRGVLIMWVCTEHFMNRDLRQPYGLRFSANTWIFCLLSGFTAALQTAGTMHGRWQWRSFLSSKALGLFPIYYLAILITLPRYLGVTRDPVAYNGPGWIKKGIFKTDYSDPWTYACDAVFLVTGMQTWIDEINHRSMNPLYYASVQWNLYLFFALVMGLWQLTGRKGSQLFEKFEKRCGGLLLAPMAIFTLVAFSVLGSLLLATQIHPRYLHMFWPVLYLPAFIVGLASAYVFTRYRQVLMKHAHLLQHQEGNGWQSWLLGRAWAHSGDLLAGVIILLVLGPWGTRHTDKALCLLAIPFFAALFVIITALQGSQSKSLVKAWILESDWANILGKLSYAIYLFHEAIGDVYLQMAVKGYYQAWKGLVPPPGTDWWTKYQLYILPWMSEQAFVLKVAAVCLSIVFGWLVSHYLIDIGLMQSLEYIDQGYQWAMKKIGEIHQRHVRGR